jgi:glutathione synthase/RimK-type ligase-like ATP-grasp enzyme
MKLGVLAWEKAEPESEGIAAIARARGHGATVFDLDDVRCGPGRSGATVTIADRELSEFDVILCRADLSTPPWTEKIQQILLLSGEPGVTMLDGFEDHIRAASKRSMLQRLALEGIPVPPTRACTSRLEVRDAFEEWGEIVVKPALGYRGIDVDRLLDGPTAGALAHAAALIDRHGVLLCQPYLRHEGDFRVLVIGDQVSACTRFDTRGERWKPFPGDDPDQRPVNFDYIQPTVELADLGLNATKAMGLTMAGVDIILSEAGLTVIEVNPVPGWAAWPAERQKVPNLQVVELAESVARANGRS